MYLYTSTLCCVGIPLHHFVIYFYSTLLSLYSIIPFPSTYSHPYSSSASLFGGYVLLWTTDYDHRRVSTSAIMPTIRSRAFASGKLPSIRRRTTIPTITTWPFFWQGSQLIFPPMYMYKYMQVLYRIINIYIHCTVYNKTHWHVCLCVYVCTQT